MKKNILRIALIGASVFMISCGGNSQKAEQETVSGPSGNCTFSYNEDKTIIGWVAYKTTNKIGVSGDFANFTIEGTQEANTPLDVIKGASITIPVSSIETQDAGRNQRIVEFFFGTFTDTEALTGKVKEVSVDGTGVLTLKMNGIEAEVPVKIAIDDAQVVIKATLNLSNWDGQAAIDALNEECKDLHAGEDGITKLWPDVDITITSELTKNCQ